MFLKLQNCVSKMIKATRLSEVNTWTCTCTYSVYLYMDAHVSKTEQNISMSHLRKKLHCEVLNQWKLKKRRIHFNWNIGQVDYTVIDTVYCMDDFFSQTFKSFHF